MECYDETSNYERQVNIDSTSNVDELYYKNTLAPNGEPWKYDCSAYEYLMQNNCWDDAAIRPIDTYYAFMVVFSIVVMASNF